MNEVERLRAEVTKAETDLRVSRRFAEMDRDASLNNPDIVRHHDRNDARIRSCEERLREAQTRLNAALIPR